jgi:hypothetical protein
VIPRIVTYRFSLATKSPRLRLQSVTSSNLLLGSQSHFQRDKHIPNMPKQAYIVDVVDDAVVDAPFLCREFLTEDSVFGAS